MSATRCHLVVEFERAHSRWPVLRDAGNGIVRTRQPRRFEGRPSPCDDRRSGLFDGDRCAPVGLVRFAEVLGFAVHVALPRCGNPHSSHAWMPGFAAPLEFRLADDTSRVATIENDTPTAWW
jgi:hypothetical protein